MEGFQLFGPGHLAALAYTVAVATLGIAAARRRAGRAVPVSLAALIAAGQLFTPVIETLFGEMSLKYSLPLELCDVASFATIAALLTGRQLAFELAWYWGLTGTFAALLTPTLARDFPDPEYIRFFAMHGGIVAGVLYLGPGRGMRPRAGSSGRVFGLTALYAGFVGLVDWALDANYFFLCRRPPGTILEAFGAWPAYLFGAAAIAAITYWLLELAGRGRSRA